MFDQGSISSSIIDDSQIDQKVREQSMIGTDREENFTLIQDPPINGKPEEATMEDITDLYSDPNFDPANFIVNL